jgi:Flp pilus assembly protein TadD
MYWTWTFAAAAMLAAATACPALCADALPMTLSENGCAQMNRGNYNAAVEIFSAVIRRDPTDLVARRRLACALIGAAREREAIKQLKLIAAVDPGNAGDLCTMASAFRRIGDDKSALALYRQAMIIDCQCSEARVGLTRVLVALGNYRAAQAICGDTLRTSRDPLLRKQSTDLMNTIKTHSLLQKVEKSG